MIGRWAGEDVVAMVKYGIESVYQDGTIRLLAYVTRAEAVAVITGTGK